MQDNVKLEVPNQLTKRVASNYGITSNIFRLYMTLFPDEATVNNANITGNR